ncbi:hypothetical protein LCGC14_1423640, partial [marine sediment metagenome]
PLTGVVAGGSVSFSGLPEKMPTASATVHLWDLKVPEMQAGKKGKCPKCGAAIVVPAPGATVTHADRRYLNKGTQMQCKNHPDVEAIDRCAACAEAFCPNCLVDIQGQKYCGSCKVLAVQGQPTAVEATMECKEAGSALTYAIVGLFCLGIILEPIAISKALKARKMMELNPRLTGSGKANAALMIAIVGLVLWVLGIIIRVSQISRG